MGAHYHHKISHCTPQALLYCICKCSRSPGHCQKHPRHHCGSLSSWAVVAGNYLNNKKKEHTSAGPLPVACGGPSWYYLGIVLSSSLSSWRRERGEGEAGGERERERWKGLGEGEGEGERGGRERGGRKGGREGVVERDVTVRGTLENGLFYF